MLHNYNNKYWFQLPSEKLLHLIEANAQKFHFLDEFRQLIIHEFLLHLTQHDILGIFGDKIADAAFVVDDASVLHSLIGSHDGVGVHAQLDAEVTHRKDAVVGLQLAVEDLLVNLRADLQVYWFMRIEFHGLIFLSFDFTIGEEEQKGRDKDAYNHAPDGCIMGHTKHLFLRESL